MMAICKHNIGPIKAFICSGPIKLQCPNCGENLVRKHSRSTAMIEFLFSAMGLPLIALLMLSIIWLPWVVLSVGALFTCLYIWDVISNPIQQVTDYEVNRENKSNLQLLAMLGLFFLAIVVLYATKT